MKNLKIFIVFSLSFSVLSCEWLNGEYSLGNGLHLWDNDKKEERIIVYCTGNCHGGIYVVPIYNKHYDSLGRIIEYVESVEFDKNWVLAKTFRIKEQTNSYYIIQKNYNIDKVDCKIQNCDSIIGMHTFGPYNEDEFNTFLKAKRIELRL